MSIPFFCGQRLICYAIEKDEKLKKYEQVQKYLEEKEEETRKKAIKAVTTSLASGIGSSAAAAGIGISYLTENPLDPSVAMGVGLIAGAGIVTAVASGMYGNKMTKEYSELSLLNKTTQELVKDQEILDNVRKIVDKDGSMDEIEKAIQPTYTQEVDYGEQIGPSDDIMEF